MLEQVDHTKVTTDLWGERWVKLCANSMTTGLSGLTGLSLREVYCARTPAPSRSGSPPRRWRSAARSASTRRQLFGAPSEAWLAHMAIASLAQAMDALKASRKQ